MNRYQALFNQYVEELSRAKDATAVWWQRLLVAEMTRGATPMQAEERVRDRWPMGPTSHPLVLAAYRKAFIACEQLNEIVAAEYAEKMQKSAEHESAGWGAEDPPLVVNKSPDDWGEEWETDPPSLLVESLFGRRDDLAAFMEFMVFSPIGEEDDCSV